MKKIVILLAICILFFSSCDNVLTLDQDIDSAQQTVNSFCCVLDDIDLAKSFLHPFSAPNKDRLNDFIINLQKAYDVDFSNGVKINNIEIEGFSLNDLSYNGSVYMFTVELSANHSTINMFFTVVDNNHGYGIHSFAIIE